MKGKVCIGSLLLTGTLLVGCSDQPRQAHSLTADVAASKITAIQTAIHQANDARDAILKADNNQRLAQKQALNKQAAVQQAIALAAKESKQLRQDAENKSRWAKKINDKAIASRTALLLAAMQQADAKQQLLEAEKAVQLARHQFDLDQQDAQLAATMQHEANKALNLVQEAEQLAALSMHQFTTNPAVENQHISVNQASKSKGITDFINPHKAKQNTDTAHVSSKKNQQITIASNIKKATQRHKTKKQPQRVKTASSSTAKITKKAIEHRPLKLASLIMPQAESLQRGHALSQKCLLCHNLKAGQKKKFGPNLFAVVDQPAGKSKHYKYSNTLATADFIWNDDNLAQWICHSGKSIKQLTGRRNARTKMPNQRICGQDAKDVVAYLRTVQSRASDRTSAIGTLSANAIATNSLTATRSLHMAGAI